jgi:hypothetical protein
VGGAAIPTTISEGQEFAGQKEIKQRNLEEEVKDDTISNEDGSNNNKLEKMKAENSKLKNELYALKAQKQAGDDYFGQILGLSFEPVFPTKEKQEMLLGAVGCSTPFSAGMLEKYHQLIGNWLLLSATRGALLEYRMSLYFLKDMLEILRAHSILL